MASAGAFNPAQNLKLQLWQNHVRTMNLLVPLDRAALWTGLGAASARSIASARRLVTLEMTVDGSSLDSGKLAQKLDTDFGPGKSDERALVWLWVSEKFAAGLQGKVTVLIKQGDLRGIRPNDDRMQKALFDELMRVDVLSPVRRNPRVTEITVLEVNAGGRPTSVFTVPRSTMWQ